MDNNGQQSVVLHASLMPFFEQPELSYLLKTGLHCKA